MVSSLLQPKLIIHGGAGNITRENLPPDSYAKYAAVLRSIHRSTAQLLAKGATALDAATCAVTLFEDCPLFNCGKGAVFTRDGTIELEASVMVTRGYRKRACGVVLVKRVKNPIKLARDMLVRGEQDGTGGGNGGDGDPSGGSGGAQGHCCLGGETVERLAESWGLEMVDESYFWTRKRWDDHERGLHDDADRKNDFGDYLGSEQVCFGNDSWVSKNSRSDGCRSTISVREEDFVNEREAGWDGKEYLPQGTVGCVALDKYGTLCVATSTGGLTNKLSCRIGDTPTIGAGFWAEEWDESPLDRQSMQPQSLGQRHRGGLEVLADGLRNVIGDCLPNFAGYQQLPLFPSMISEKPQPLSNIRAVAMSGTGNGDSFLRLAAARTVGAIVRFSPDRSLASAVNQIAGPLGELQRSAGNRWGKTGEGEGGIIGIEIVDGKGEVVFDFNCGGMFRCWVDAMGVERVMVFRDEY